MSHHAANTQTTMARMSRSMEVGRTRRPIGSADFDHTLGRPTTCHIPQSHRTGQWAR
ncbi:hypothetical protein SEA_BUDSKI_38 [Gordonia phage Budski]|nr:hypothetical protein SEA_BUDSKI_38 [Gordonia phage Budski]